MVSWQAHWPEEIWNDMQIKKIGTKEVTTFPNLQPSLYHTLVCSANQFGETIPFHPFYRWWINLLLTYIGRIALKRAAI